jgi:hypothetical protein
LPEEIRITIQIWSYSRRGWYLGRRTQIFKPWRRSSSSRGRRVFAKSAAAQIILKPRQVPLQIHRKRPNSREITHRERDRSGSRDRERPDTFSNGKNVRHPQSVSLNHSNMPLVILSLVQTSRLCPIQNS